MFCVSEMALHHIHMPSEPRSAFTLCHLRETSHVAFAAVSERAMTSEIQKDAG